MNPVLQRDKIRRLRAVGDDLCAEGQGEAEKSSKTTASDIAKVTARPGGRQEDDAEGETKVAIEKELRAQRSDKEQSIT